MNIRARIRLLVLSFAAFRGHGAGLVRALQMALSVVREAADLEVMRAMRARGEV